MEFMKSKFWPDGASIVSVNVCKCTESTSDFVTPWFFSSWEKSMFSRAPKLKGSSSWSRMVAAGIVALASMGTSKLSAELHPAVTIPRAKVMRSARRGMEKRGRVEVIRSL